MILSTCDVNCILFTAWSVQKLRISALFTQYCSLSGDYYEIYKHWIPQKYAGDELHWPFYDIAK